MSVSHAPPDSDQADAPDTADTHNGSPVPALPAVPAPPVPALPVPCDSMPNWTRTPDSPSNPSSPAPPASPVPPSAAAHPSGSLPQARDFPLTHVIVVCLIVHAFLGPLADFIVRSLERLLPQWRPTFTGR